MKNTKHLMIALLAGAATLTAMPLSTQAAGPDHDHSHDHAEATDAPKMDKKAKKVWDKSIEASMGEKADEKWIKSVKSTGTMSMPAQNMTLTMSLLLAPGEGMRLDMEIPGMGAFTQGLSGGIAWSSNMMEGPKILEGAEAEQMLKQGDLFADLHWEDYYTSITYKNEETVTMPDGTEIKVDVLELVPVDDDAVMTNYYSKESGLIIKVEAMTAGPGGAKIPTTSYMSDFRDVEGYMTPFKTVTSTGPMEMTITFDSVEINVALDDNAFDLPDDIKELLEED